MIGNWICSHHGVVWSFPCKPHYVNTDVLCPKCGVELEFEIDLTREGPHPSRIYDGASTSRQIRPWR